MWVISHSPNRRFAAGLGGLFLWLLLLGGPPDAGAQWVPVDDQDYGFGRTFDKIGDPDLVPPFLPRFQLQNVTLYHGFSTFGVPFVRNDGGIPRSFSRIGTDGQFGGSATFGWHERIAGTNFSFVYRPQASGQYRHSEWNRFRHTWRLNFGRNQPFTLMKGRRWQWTFRLDTRMNTFEQWFFDPPLVRSVANSPVALDELISRTADGEFSNEEIASILTGAPIVERKAGIDQELSQVLAATAQTNYTYQYSPRLSLDLGVSARRLQTLLGGRTGETRYERCPPSGDNNGEPCVLGNYRDNGFFLRDATHGQAQSTLRYELSRHTDVGGSFSLSRSYSSFANAYYTRQTAFVNRQIGPRWSVGLQAGVGQIHRIGTSAASTWVTGASLSRTLRDQSFRFSIYRDVGDSFGLGSRTTLTSSAQWTWRLPDRNWTISAHLAQTNTDVIDLRDYSFFWSGIAWTRQLSRSTFATTRYTFINNSSAFRGLFGNIRGHRVMFSFIWVPQPQGDAAYFPGIGNSSGMYGGGGGFIP